MLNPWGLTEAQARVMDAYIETGSHKAVAKKLNVELCTVGWHVCHAKKRMKSRSKIQHFIEWDRWRRAEEAASESVEFKP